MLSYRPHLTKIGIQKMSSKLITIVILVGIPYDNGGQDYLSLLRVIKATVHYNYCKCTVSSYVRSLKLSRAEAGLLDIQIRTKCDQIITQVFVIW